MTRTRTRRRIITAVAMLCAVSALTAPAAGANFAPRALWGSVTTVPLAASAVTAPVGRVTDVKVAFHAGAAASGRIAVTGGQGAGDLRVVVVSKADGAVLGSTRSMSDGTWHVGGLQPVAAAYVCADNDDTMQRSEFDHYGARCAGSSATWSDASRQNSFPYYGNGYHGRIDMTPPPVRDVPAGATTIVLRAGEVTPVRSFTLPGLASLHASITAAPDAQYTEFVLFDSNGRVVPRTGGTAQTAVFAELHSGAYRLCVRVTVPTGSTSPGYAPSCNGGVPWPDAEEYGGTPPPPAANTRVTTVAEASSSVPSRTDVSITPPPGSAITGTLTVAGRTSVPSEEDVITLYAGDHAVDRAYASPTRPGFSLPNLPARDDWRICAVAAEAIAGRCWKQAGYQASATTPPADATPAATTIGSTTGGIDLTVPDAPPATTPPVTTPPTQPRIVTLSGTVRQSDGKPLQNSTITVFQLIDRAPFYELDAVRSTGATGAWSFTGSDYLGDVYEGQRVQVCASGPKAHPATGPIPTGTYVDRCGAPFVVHGDANNRRTGIDFTLARGGALVGLLTAGGASWGGSIAVAERSGHAVVVHNFTTTSRSGRAVASGVPGSAIGYDVCFVPDDRHEMTAAHPTGLLAQCANGKDWFGTDADHRSFVDNVDPIH